MKKLSLYIFIGLLWCNVGFAGKFLYKCVDQKDPVFERRFEFDTSNWRYRDIKPNLSHLYDNLILTKKLFYNYSVDGGPFGYYVQTRIFVFEKTPKGFNFFVFDTTKIDKKIFEEIISKLDQIDNGKLNKKLGSDGQFIYSLSSISNDVEFQNEFKKYKIIEPYAHDLKENNPNHTRIRMVCKEIKK